MGRSSHPDGLAVLLTAMVAIGCAAPPIAGPGPSDAGPGPAASAPPLARRCEPGDGRCLSPDRVERCDAQGAQIVAEACATETTCTGGRCVPTTVAPAALFAEKPYDPGAILAVSAEGFLDGWSLRAPLEAIRVQAIVASLEASGGAVDLDTLPPPIPLCAPSGYVVPQRAGKSTGINGALLAGVLIAPRTGPAELWAGVSGKVTVYLRGAKVLHTSAEGEPSPRPDEVVAAVDLVEGANPILVLLERTPQGAPGLWLRLRAPGHAPLGGLLFAPGPSRDPACSAADLATVRFDPAPVPGGFDVGVTLGFHGLAPRSPAPVGFVADLLEGRTAREIARGTLDPRGPTPGAIAATLAVRAPIAPSARLRLHLDGAPDAVRRELPLAYRGALSERVLALRTAVGTLSFPPGKEGDRDSLLAEVERLITLLAEQDGDLPYLKQRTDEAEEIARGFAAGRDPYEDRTGIVHRAYRSRLDGRLQPYLALVPNAIKKGKRLPLILAAHGLNGQPGQALRTVVGAAPDRGNMNVLSEARHLPSLPDYGAIIAAPWGYGNSGQRLPGEDDVLRVIEEMKASYPVDEDRVSLTGYSLGGTVSFVVPLHYPDLFAAAAPLCGYPNFAQWNDVRDPPHTPWDEVLIAKRSIVRYAENGLHLPLHIIHGGQDGPARSAVIADRYRDLGYARKFDVQDDLDHDVWEYGYEKGRMITWLRGKKRPKAPRHVRLSTGEARYDRAYWVRLIESKDPEAFSSIDAEESKDHGEIAVTTRNVTRFALDLAAFKPRAVVVDGAKLAPCGGEGISYFTMDDGGPHCSTEAPSVTGRKHAGLSGPLDDIQRHPVLVVYGTGDPANAEVNKLCAELAHAPERASLLYPMKADVDVTDEDLARSSIVLIGGPRSNRITAALVESLPVRFDEEGVTVRGKRYEGATVGVSLIAPNPRNPEEYVVLHAGVGPRGTLASRHLPSLAPDYLVYDERITTARGGLLLGARTVLDGGFFDRTWR